MHVFDGLHPINWQLGTVGDYLTLLAVVIAWIALRHERRATNASLKAATDALELDRERWRQALLDRERWQSQYVSVTVLKRVKREHGGLSNHVELDCSNDSQARIYDVDSFVYRGDEVEFDYSLEPLSVKAHSSFTRIVFVDDDDDLLLEDKQFGITFIDGSGVQWVRYADGSLRRSRDGESVVDTITSRS